jgi:hypothetical protein
MTADISMGRLWAGRVISGIAILLLTLDAIGKIVQPAPVVEATLALGFRHDHILPIGILLSVGVALYAVPRTSVLGAIYLTGFLGGATASQFRLDAPLASHVLFGGYIAVLVWSGLALRNPRLLALLRSADRRQV